MSNRRFWGLICVAYLGGMLFWIFVTLPLAKPQPEKAPMTQRSLEVIDHEGPWLYLVRVRTCYYVIVGSGGHERIVHLEDCPSPAHQARKQAVSQ